ncbi:NAD(P)-dependent oxidoreductase [Crocinitomix sp.]|nr:NAD(P)-dependent oxidoreductase [Crocinitomix sp.]
MSKILITGSNGSIGSVLVDRLSAEGHELVLANNPVLRIEHKTYFEQFENPKEIDFLYHLAANSFVPKSWESPADFIEVNVLGTTHVLEFCRKNEIKLIFISSYAYGIPQYLPIDEEHPLSAANPYALSKIMGEDLCRFYGKNFGLNYLIVRPFNIYGSMQNKSLLIPEIIEQINEGEGINVKDLKPKRDYVFIDDLVDFLALVMGDINNKAYNIGSGQSHSVKELIDLIQEIWGSNLPVYSEASERQNEIPETIAEISQAKADFGWSPKFSLADGLSAIKKRGAE